MKSITVTLVLIATLLTASIGVLSQEKKEPPAPTAPSNRFEGECCLWRLALVTSGKLEHKLKEPHRCPTGETAQGSGFLELKPLKSMGLPCDEKHMLIPDGSQLNAAIHPIHRKDDLAHIRGTFTIMYQDKPIFAGDIELFHRVNTHSPPFCTDPCDRRDHMQGWLTGTGVESGPAKDYSLRAMLVARTDPRQEGTAGYSLGTTHINGVIVRCKR